MDIQDWLKINKERIIKLMELEDVQSKLDPCEQPYKSQYAARDILQSCISDLDGWMKEDQNRCNHIAYLVYFNLSYRLANNFISTEERYAGEEIVFSLCKKVDDLHNLELFIRRLDKITSTPDDGSQINTTNSPQINDLEISSNDQYQLWISWLAGILLRIYNACGLLWAGKIMSSSDDPGYDNSIKYLNRAKRIYRMYKQYTRLNPECLQSPTEIALNYVPPHCFDEVMLEMFQYETAYLRNECYLMEGVDKYEALKFDLFESDYTTTLFLLAQTFGKMGSDSGLKHKSAKYCYWTLHRQLNSFKYDPVEWSLNAATLSQYYVVEGEFSRARHCIAAAQTILKEAINRPTPGPKEESKKTSACEEAHSGTEIKTKESLDNAHIANKEDSQATCTHVQSNLSGDCETTVSDESVNKAEVPLCGNEPANGNVVHIGDKCCSKDASESESESPTVNPTSCRPRRLLPDPMSESRLWDDDVYEEKRVQGEADIDRCWISYGLNLLELSFDRSLPDLVKDKEKLIVTTTLPDFNLELAAIERNVTDEWISTYEGARQLFLFVQRKIGSARQYYTLDFRCSDAIELICDHSKAFKAISNFEISTERKCVMHKKRIDMLSDLLKTLNQRYYQVPCRKMMLEIGEIYSAMINLKLSLLETTAGPNDSIKLPENAKGVVQKIRLLGQKGLAVYDKFLESYRTTSGQMPDVFAEEDVRPILIAHFYMARMFSKILEPESSARLKNLVKSLEHYQFIVNYCAKHTEAARQMDSELDSCKDMVVLLPRKIDKLRSE